MAIMRVDSGKSRRHVQIMYLFKRFPVVPSSRIAAFLLATTTVFSLHADPHMHRWEEAGRDPDRIALTWTGDPATSIAVSWRTSSDISEAFAEIALSTPEPRFDFHSRRQKAETESLELSSIPENHQDEVNYHSVAFEDLKPSTKYLYRVGDGGDYWSEWVEFRTASDKSEPFSFVYFGDAQNDVLSHWSRVIRAAYAKAPTAGFFLHAGDLINDGHFDEEWGQWFKAGGWVHSSVPSVVVTGNHEYRPLPNREAGTRYLALMWQPQFQLPTYDVLPPELAETVYYHDYQGARIIVLNSNAMQEQQVEWLDQRLEENPGEWSIVTFHHPMFSSGKNRDNQAMRDLWKPVLDKHKVDLVLQGHDHTYARGHIPVSMRANSNSQNVQTMYINSVSGPKMYEFMETGWDVYAPEGVVLDRSAENSQFFQVVSIDGSKLTYKAFTANGLLYDAFQLIKKSNGAKRISRLTVDVDKEYRYENTAPYGRGPAKPSTK